MPASIDSSGAQYLHLGLQAAMSTCLTSHSHACLTSLIPGLVWLLCTSVVVSKAGGRLNSALAGQLEGSTGKAPGSEAQGCKDAPGSLEGCSCAAAAGQAAQRSHMASEAVAELAMQAALRSAARSCSEGALPAARMEPCTLSCDLTLHPACPPVAP